MLNLKTANDKFISGKGMSDEELSLLIAQYQLALSFLKQTDERQFDLFRKELQMRLNRLISFQDERKLL